MSTDPAAPPTANGVLAFIVHRFRGGPWHVFRRYRAVAWMGGVEIDLSEAILPPDGAELELFAVMGVITVRVPSDVDVVLSGDSITWTITEEEDPVPSGSAVRRHLRIRSRAFFGTVHLRRVSPRSEAVQST